MITSKQDMIDYLHRNYSVLCGSDEDVENAFKWSSEIAIYWLCNDWHDGQASLLYSILSTSTYQPSCLTSGIEDEEDDLAHDMYDDLVAVLNLG